jgi:hypothetical protein
LNFLTQAHVLKSIKEECNTGERVQLDWRINGWTKPGFGRSPAEHKIIDQRPIGFMANDGQSHSFADRLPGLTACLFQIS